MSLSTPVITLAGLTAHILDYSASAFDPDLRYAGDDDDAVLLGKLRMLDVLAESLLDGLAGDDERQLLYARSDLDRAEKHLMRRIANRPAAKLLTNSLPATHGETPPPPPAGLVPRASSSPTTKARTLATHIK